MKALFVSVKEGQPHVDWLKLSVFAALVMAVSAVLVEAVWYLITDHLSGAALVVALLLGALIVVRFVVRAVSYQEQELEETASPS
jgi:hypothetical protein